MDKGEENMLHTAYIQQTLTLKQKKGLIHLIISRHRTAAPKVKLE